ncbi:colanic acid/amylovoran biosynthesis glycosyltransferase [Flavobacteriaceae bacterium MAR_2010_105]|nr:colanic acid/amylovoran biosynthesis glycosyltransferase [Flavobacteriaceae bacterium MAR_2010_105]
MRKQLSIAIFSGELPSSTFIETLIHGVAKAHKVYLFGIQRSKLSYTNPHIKIFKTPNTHGLNLLYTLYRLVLLGLQRPKDVIGLFKEIKRYNSRYEQWTWFSRFLPIVLYRPDVFHMQWTRDLEFYAFLKTRFKIPIVVSLRGAHVHYTPIVAPYIADVYRASFPLMDGFHAVSQAMAQEALRYGADASKVKVIHSPIALSLFDRFVPYHKTSKASIKIGAVGRFHWVKGMRYAFDACALLKVQSFAYEFAFVSSNAIDEASLFQIDQLGIGEQVTILSALEQSALFEVMRSFDVLVLPSLNEGIANVVLEAMALGIPVISTNCGGMPEVVIPNETGWLVPVRDAQALADAIVEVSQTSEQELQRITKNAHDLVKQQFNAEESIQAFLELYEDVLINDY